MFGVLVEFIVVAFPLVHKLRSAYNQIKRDSCEKCANEKHCLF